MPDGRVLIRKYDVTVDVSRGDITAALYKTRLGTYQVVAIPDNVDVVYPVQALEPIIGRLLKKPSRLLGVVSALHSAVR